ncbi:UNVERIFIED_CONTAM: hypothetical protein Scaly_0052200 [Sesamum calycinum]|uniref:Retroviral polymerase SH3-like domain-containing protein n=1 Tax=Sesamum calycinum TaxID=2727403 RepID=A0AAW2SUB2_9LAMI
MLEKIASNQLMLFLMGLINAYDHVRSQVLLMDPLPTVGKAYSMFLRVEKQREVYSGISGEDWYRDLMEQRRRNGRPPNARVMNVQLEDGESSIQGTSAIETQSNLSALIRTETKEVLVVGYAHGRKGYKVMDLETENIHIARDVVFHETTFPFHNITESEVLCPLPMISQDEEIRKLQDIEHVKETVEDLTTQQEQSIIPRRNPKIFVKHKKNKNGERLCSKKLMR